MVKLQKTLTNLGHPMNATYELTNFIKIDVDRQNKKVLAQLSKAIMAFLVIAFYACWIAASKTENFALLFFNITLLLFLSIGYIPLYFYASSHSLLHSFKYAYKFLKYFIFKKRLKHNLQKHFIEYYNHFSKYEELAMFERFYNLIIHDEKYRYDNNHIVKSLQNIEKYLAKQQTKRKPLTNFLSVFNNKFGNKSLSDPDSVQKVEFFPNQTVSK